MGSGRAMSNPSIRQHRLVENFKMDAIIIYERMSMSWEAINIVIKLDCVEAEKCISLHDQNKLDTSNPWWTHKDHLTVIELPDFLPESM